MFLLVPAHPGFPGQIPQSRKTVVCVCVCRQSDTENLHLNQRQHQRMHHTHSTLGVNDGGCFAVNCWTAAREGLMRLSRASSDDLYDVFPCIAPAVLCNKQNTKLGTHSYPPSHAVRLQFCAHGLLPPAQHYNFSGLSSVTACATLTSCHQS